MVDNQKIGLLAGFCISVGTAIGGGLWVNPVVTASIGGPIVIPYLVLAIAPILCAIPGYAALVKAWPVTPGHYYYLTRFLAPKNRKLGKFVGWSALWPWMGISVSVAFVQVSLGAAGYLNNLIPAIPFQIHQLILIAFTLAIVWFGLRAVGWTEITLVGLLFLSLVVMFVLGMANIDTSNFTPANPNGHVSAIGAAALVAGSISNGFLIIDLSDDIRDAADSVPKILLSGLLTNAFVATLIVILALSIVPAPQLAGQTLVFVTGQYLPEVLNLFPITGAILASVSTTLAFVLLFNRYCIAASEEGILPGWIQTRNRHDEPIYVLLAVAILSTTIVIADLPISSLSYGAILAVMSYPLLISIASLRFTYEYEDLFEKQSLGESSILTPRVVRVFSSLAIVFISALFIFGAVTNPMGFALYAIAALSGIGIFAIRWITGSKEEIIEDGVTIGSSQD